MSRTRYYSPAIKRHLVTALYHEARKQGRPMTEVANDIKERGLREMEPWPQPESGGTAMILSDASPPYQVKINEPLPRP